MYISISKLCKSYGGEVKTTALKDAFFELNKGEIGVILGPSGSGKSTLMNILGGIDQSDSGTVLVGNENIAAYSEDALSEYRRSKVGFIFQSYNLVPHLTVEENIEVVENISASPLEVSEMLSAVGLSKKKDRFPRELSGGEQQRVAIARAIVKNPELLLCDEITGALDYESAIEVLSLVQEINQKYETTVVMITHNSAISAMAHRVYKFRSGKVVDITINNSPAPARRVQW